MTEKTCNKCKKIWTPEEDDINKDGNIFKYCKNCRNYANKYFEKNRNKFNETHKCPCGGQYYLRHRKRHFSCFTHINWEKENLVK